jgi:hypothetical protein
VYVNFKFQIKIRFLLLFLLLVVCFAKPVLAADIDVSLRVGESEINLSGYASPSSVITFMENGAVVGTTTTASDGFFVKQFITLDEGVHLINIFVVDLMGKANRTVSLSYVVVAGQNVNLLNLYFPPTINAGFSFQEGDMVNVWGYSVPNSSIQINLTGKKNISKNVISGIDGYYSYGFNTSNFESGNYSISAILNKTSSVLTLSENVDFQLSARSIPTSIPGLSGALSPTVTVFPAGVSPTISLLPTGIPCPYEFVNLCFIDKEKKGWIDSQKDLPAILKEFSQVFGTKGDVLYDINQDGVVDALDLSIILFHTQIKPYEISRSSLQDARVGVYVTGATESARGVVVYFTLVRNAAVVSVVSLPLIFLFIKRSKKKKRKLVYFLIAVILIIALIKFYLDKTNPSFKMTSENPKIRINQVAEVELKFDAENVPVNTLQVGVRFDKNMIQIKSVDTNTSVANVFIKKEFSNAKGEIFALGGLTGTGFVGKEARFARIFFVAKKIGRTAFRFDKSMSKIVLGNGKGNQYFTNVRDFEFEVVR